MPAMSRKRAIKVCNFCHVHKVRCDVDTHGSPCTKCVEIGQECKIRARKQYSGRNRALRAISKTSSNEEDNASCTQRTLARPELIRIVAAAIPDPSSRIASIFIEESGYGDILNAISRTTDRHFHIPVSAERALAPEDLEHLEAKGCFALPEDSEELVQAYFQYVHSNFPVIDAAQFLGRYATSGLEGVNLLLLWSMFSISASYVSTSPQRVYKKMYKSRAKLLFDLTDEKDKIVLVQSALLLSFWFEDGEDVKQSWYWSSIAFSIAQTLGLHREMKLDSMQADGTKRSLWRNVWHCCMYRDVWLSFGMGRPLRIQTSDCSTALPREWNCFSKDLLLHGEPIYTEEEVEGFSDAWKSLISLSGSLREHMTSGISPSARIEALQVRMNTQGFFLSNSLLLTRVQRHLQLHENAALIAISRRQGLHDTISEAADRTTTIIQALLGDQTSAYAAPIVIPLVVPAMVTYLRTVATHDLVASSSTKDKLVIYSEFLTALEDNYPAASILKGIFGAAQDALFGTEGAEAKGNLDLGSADQFVASSNRSWLGDVHFP